MKINVGYLLSYDYEFFLTSVRQLYEHVDKIVVGIDIDMLTWSGNAFDIPQSFFSEIADFDKRNIIEFYREKFFIPELSPMECETRERNMVLEKLGKGWNIQLDVDEYIYDFEVVKKFLKKYWYLTIFPKLTPIVFTGRLVTLFKNDKENFYFIDEQEYFPFITNQKFNKKARQNPSIYNHNSGINVIHQSWARNELEIYKKINNWGHRDDFDTEKYFTFWKSINSSNYNRIKNFHPLSPNTWKKLQLMRVNDINNFIKGYSLTKIQTSINLNILIYFKTIIYNILK